MAIGVVLAVGVLIGLATVVSRTDQRPADLRVVTRPLVGAEISVDGVSRDTDAIDGLPLPPGVHRICFGYVEGYLPPSCREVRLTAGATEVVEATYEPAGTLHVTVTPTTLSAQIEVDGIARDDAPITIPVAQGTHQVCAAELDGFEVLDCVEVEVRAPQQTSVTFEYLPTVEP